MVSNIKEGDIVKGKDDEETQVVRVMEVYLARHGVKEKKKDPRGDEYVNLVDSSPGSIYEKIKAASPKTYSPERVYLAHTDRIRTAQTGQAIALAKTGQRKPKNLEELAASDYRGMTIRKDDRMSIYDGEINEDSFRNKGSKYVVDYALQNREAVQMDGQLIEPHVSIEARLRDALRDGIENVLSGQFDCAILVTHGYHAETMRGIANGRGSTARTTDDLGGEFDMEEFDTIRIAELADGTYKCYVEYKGNVEERKLKDILGYDIKGDKARAKEHARIIREEDEVNERMNPQMQALSPAAFGRN
jgi:hypothetical protein